MWRALDCRAVEISKCKKAQHESFLAAVEHQDFSVASESHMHLDHIR